MTNNEPLIGMPCKIDPASRHALLTPLNHIIGYSELLAEQAESNGHEFLLCDLNKIKHAAQQLAGLLDALFAVRSGECNSSVSCSSLIKNQESNEVLPKTREDHYSSAKSGTILVVDDNESNREILSQRLQRQGHCVATAENGFCALAKLRTAPFDLVLLDVMMPGLDGYEVLKQIKADQKLRHIPVFIISSYTDMDSVIKCIETGAEDYLPKPFNPTLLKARIGAALEKKRLREQERHFIEQALRAEAALERHRVLTLAVAGIAHEINTPLGIACTGISIIENRFSLPAVQDRFKSGRESEEWLQDILDSADLIKKNIVRANRLVENFKKISVNQMVEHMESVNLPSIIKEAIDLYKMSAKQAKLSFELDVSGVQKSQIWYGYPGYLIQILMNFFQNVERYAYPGGDGGKVTIAVKDLTGHEGDDRFILIVRDFGAGIKPEDIEKIFDPFFTTGRGKGGTGLGLSIVSNIVTMALNGIIEVTSVPGSGTCFSIQFPKNLNE